MHFKGKRVLEKTPMKGGWTYATIPIQFPKTKRAFGWVIVSGSIDELAFENVKLMPMKSGELFLSIKVEWRKKIKKEAGDEVFIDLYLDEQELIISVELTELFDLLPDLKFAFEAMNEKNKAAFLDRFLNARTEEEKEGAIKRLVK